MNKHKKCFLLTISMPSLTREPIPVYVRSMRFPLADHNNAGSRSKPKKLPIACENVEAKLLA